LQNFNLIDFFPKQYEPRPSQIEALEKIEQIWASGKKYVIACMPTGIGKSHIALAASESTTEIDSERKRDILAYQLYRKSAMGDYLYDMDHINKPKYGSFILTMTKALQDQYLSLFPEHHTFKGKNNYQCQVDLNQTTDNAPCIFDKKIKTNCFSSCICPYYEAKNKSIYSKTSILNYRSFFNLRPFLQKREMFVCDEADGIEDELVGHFTIEINYSLLKSCDIAHKKLITDNITEARSWLFDIYNQVLDQIKDLKKQALKISKITSADAQYSKLMQKLNKLSRLQGSMSKAIEYWDECNFLIEEKSAKRVIFVPYDIRPLFKEIFNVADKVLLMSATLSNHKHFAKSMGISENEYEYIELLSPFNSEKSPIYCTTKYNLSYSSKNKDLDNIINACIELCKKHKDYKGVIHTHTNSITQEFYKYLKNDSRFLFRQEGITNEEILEQHKRALHPTVLISPSLDTGISLDGDLGRFQIIVKAPYLPLSSKRIKKKFDSDSNQYAYSMLNNLVQMAGRCTRSKDDYSITYILDGNATRAITENKDILPKHFLNRIH
jgi:ATP-dependent DNA helicase DinG